MTRNTAPKGIVGIALLLMVCLSLLLPASVQAVQTTPTPVSKCFVCHEDLYYLYDTGKWYCECGVPMDCLCCHGGDPEAVTEDKAHAGMVVKPLSDDAAACQRCHPTDYDVRAEKVASALGVVPAHPTSSIAGTPTATPQSAAGAQVGTWLDPRLFEPLRLITLSILLIVLAGLIYVGYRCWKADCLVNRG